MGTARKSNDQLASLFKKALQHQSMKQYPEAESCYVQIIEVIPDHADSLHYLGVVKHLMGDQQSALKLLKKASKLAPKDTELLFNLGCIYEAKMQWHEACAAYQKAIRLKPYFAMAHNNLAISLLHLNDKDGFKRHVKQAYKLDPNRQEILVNYASFLSSEDHYYESIECYKKALDIEPHRDQAIANLSNVLYKTGQFYEGWRYLRQLKFSPDNISADNSIALFLYNYETQASQEDIYSIHKQWGLAAHQKINHNQRDRFYSVRSNRQKLRIGYVSPDFRNHAVAFFIENLLEHHNKNQFELFAYSDVSIPDMVTTRLQEYFDAWRDVSTVSDAELFQLIVQDGIDILVDLAGHSAHNRLMVFCKKPAPVQISYLGYPNTTGLPTIDYRITDQWSDPPGQTDRWHTETLIRLNTGFLCYKPPLYAPEVASLPFLKNPTVTFGSFNNMPKINDEVVKTWSIILKRVSNSCLILKNKIFADPVIQSYTKQRFEKCGIDPDRITLHAFIEKDEEALDLYNRIDIALDTFPYNGTTTTCEALWMGAPVVTLIGESHVARVSYSILNQIGLPELAASTIEDYIELAVSLANNPRQLAEIRKQLRSRCQKSMLTNGEKFTELVESVYRETWRLHQEKMAKIQSLCHLGSDSANKQEKPRIAVLYHLARTGGTLISKCLGAMQQTVLLSEIHPVMSVMDPLIQAHRFFGLLDEQELRLLSSSEVNYIEKIQIIYNKVQQSQQYLLIRDWSHLDFTARPFITQPTHQLSQGKYLAESFTVREFSTVRHPLDSYLSLNKLPIMQGQMSIKSYIDGYHAFAKKAKKTGFIRYEDFCQNPDKSLQTICETLDIPFDPGYKNTYQDYTNITGDTHNPAQKQGIRTPVRKPFEPAILQEMESLDNYWKTLELLGYQ